MRILSNLNKAYKVFKQNKSATSLKAVFPSKENPFKTWTINKNFLKNVSKKIKNINDQFNAPRQILPKTYRQTGTIEFFKINYKSKISSMSGRKILPFEVSEYEALDIDNIKDLIKGSKIIKKYPFKFINPSINK